jgi:hypothetical protein
VTEKKTRDERLAEQLEAERKMAEDWDGATSGGIFSVGKADRIVTARHEEIRDVEQVAERWEDPVIVDAATPVPEVAARGSIVGALIGLLVVILVALALFALCSPEPPPLERAPIGPEGTR